MPALNGSANRTRKSGPVRRIMFEMDADLYEAFEEFRAKDRRSMRTTLESAVEEFLHSRKALPSGYKNGAAK